MALRIIEKHVINLVDSAASELLKIGTGTGESRLYMGQATRLDFFRELAKDVQYFFFTKRDMSQYLLAAKEEYENPSQNYVHKSEFPQYYQDNIQKVSNADEFTKLYFDITYDSSRCFYALQDRSRQDYELLRGICIPRMTQFVFTKIQSTISNNYYINIMPIFNKQYTAEELGAILKAQYDNEPAPKKPAIYLFGFRYAKYIKEKRISVTKIIEHSGIGQSFDTELNNAINIYEKCVTKGIGLNPDADQLWGCVLESEDVGRPSGTSNTDDELQVIYFGAPGTGKSFQLEEDTKSFDHMRTIFHPDSDYASFVGCYKPVMDGGKIVYKFRPQAFIMAYVNAWLSDKPYYLIIEEINRGNCAQIFGDIFQLLDRKNGVSDYTIIPDTDLKNFLFETFNSPESLAIIQQKQLSIPEDILQGTGMRLPANFYLRATMNTSDQSLFPMDSAFKRRWAWRHFSIKDEGKNFKIEIDDQHKYDWWQTIESLNSKIYSETKSADKQLGYWFAKLPFGKTVISKEDFVSKVLFYLWNDVFKDYSFDSKNAFSEEIQFDKLFTSDGQIDKAMVIKFMDKNGINNEASVTFSTDTTEEEQS